MRTISIRLAALLLAMPWSPSAGNSLEHIAEPQFTGPVVFDRTEVELGQTFTFTATLWNANPLSAGFGGRIVVSFPDLTGPDDHMRVADAENTSGDPAGYVESAVGSSIRLYYECSMIAAQYLVVEYVDQTWSALEAHTINLVVTPPRAGTFLVDVRGQMHPSGVYPGCAGGASALPPNGSAGSEDQQSAPVRRFEVTVTSPDPVQPLSWGRLKSWYYP